MRAVTRARLLFGTILLATLVAGLGRLPLIDPDEGRYARTSQEMMQRGDYVVPYLDGAPRLKKPVLSYWLEIASFTLFGWNETAARLPSALAAGGILLWLYLFARRRAGERTAVAACAILATTPLFFAMARTTTTDMTLAFFVFGATVSLYAGMAEPSPAAVHVVAGGVCLGLALLTKGPVAIVFPLLGVTAALLARRRAPITVAGRAVAAAWIAVLVAAPWLTLLFHRMGFDQVLEIWRHETLERFEGGLDHPESPFYYLLTSPLTFFPWSAFVPVALVAAYRRLKRGEGLRPLLLSWAVGAFVFFSLGRGKLDSYLLPITPAVALLVALALTDEVWLSRTVRWGAWLLAAVAGALLLPLEVGHTLRDNSAALVVLSLVAGIAAAVAGALSFAGRGRLAQPALAWIAGAGLVGAALFVPESFAEGRSARALVSESRLAETSETVYAFRMNQPSLAFYLARPAIPVSSKSVLLRSVENGRAASVLIAEERRELVGALLEKGFRVASRDHGRVILRRPWRGETDATAGSPAR
ncbi:MAG: glycosyltransferase family 39 protein [Acidobacteria bacterium]|nr:glycosyltransferase family 39 protein [Acidobacteriota bacterium]